MINGTRDLPIMAHPVCHDCFDNFTGRCRVYGSNYGRCSLRKEFDRGAGREQVAQALGIAVDRWNVDVSKLRKNGLAVVGAEYLELLEKSYQERLSAPAPARFGL